MYDRTVEGQDLNFQVSGMLWQRSLVMRDLETKTLWSHLLGKGMRGKHEGFALKILPASMTSWGDWKTRYPETTLLAMSRTSRRYLDDAWSRPDSFVFGIPKSIKHPAAAVTLSKLQKNKLIHLESGSRQLVFTYGEKGGSAQAFDCSLDGKTLSFESSGKDQMKDQQTETVWSQLDGKALSGPMKGQQLSPIAGTISFTQAWRSFFPDSKIED